MFSCINSAAPAIYSNEISFFYCLPINHTISFRFVNMEFIEADNANFIELRNCDSSVRSAAASCREKTIDFQNNADIVRNRIGAY